MSNQYEVEYKVIMTGGKALVMSDSVSDALYAFNLRDENIRRIKEPEGDIVLTGIKVIVSEEVSDVS